MGSWEKASPTDLLFLFLALPAQGKHFCCLNSSIGALKILGKKAFYFLLRKHCIERRGAKRIAIDSASVFVHKIIDPQMIREKMFQLATLVQMAQGIGFFSTDIPYGSEKISRFGVEETVVDGIILLTSTVNGLKRERFLEIYKLRNTAHVNGKHKMSIKHGGITIQPSEHRGRDRKS